MEKNNLEKLMNSSIITISKEGSKVVWNILQKMNGEELLECDIKIKNHKAEFFKGVIPDGHLFVGPLKYGIGYHYRNVGTCASKENESAIELINSAYNTSLCWNSEDKLAV